MLRRQDNAFPCGVKRSLHPRAWFNASRRSKSQHLTAGAIDLTQTLDQSLSGISPLLGTGNTFDGFRIATSNEVISLLNSTGIPISTITADPVVFANATAMTSLLGETMQPAFPDNYTGSRALTDEGDVYGYYSANGTDLNTSILTGVINHPTVGVWLVRDAIPEPSTIAFVGVFGGGILFIRRHLSI